MDDVYSILNLPENASREELKTAFIAWKKSRQQILQTGTREEQTQAANEISTMTKLYKEICGISDSSNYQRKSDKNIDNTETHSTRESNIPSPTSPDLRSSYSENNPPKILNMVFCIAIIVFCGAILYLFNKDSPTFSLPDLVQNKTQDKVNPIVTNNNKSTEKITNYPVESNPKHESQNTPEVADKNVGKTPAQRGAIQTLLDFHENITKKSLRQAYDCMSYDLQNEISYEGWIPGFNTTVSSTPSNITVVSELEDRIVLTYDLTAVDNPGGTRTFKGTVVMVKTSSGWKIDDVTNK